MKAPLTPDLIAQYRLFRERIEQFLHLVLLMNALQEGTCEPKSLAGYKRGDYALTLREVIIAWVSTFFDPRPDSLNAFRLWP